MAHKDPEQIIPMVSYGIADYGYGTLAAWERLQAELEEGSAKDEAREAAKGDPPRFGPQRHCYGNRSIWKPVDPTDPWSPLVVHPALRDIEEHVHTMDSEQAERALAGRR